MIVISPAVKEPVNSMYVKKLKRQSRTQSPEPSTLDQFEVEAPDDYMSTGGTRYSQPSRMLLLVSNKQL
jgi:hypothetical protein